MRRATIDDLAALRKLWPRAGLPVVELEKRLTEFQVVETPDGNVLGALGIQIAGEHGKIHSEAYDAPEIADELRWRLWERVQSVARNHRLRCLWIEQGTSRFLLDEDFEAAGSESLKMLPPSFGDPKALWWMLKLRDSNADEVVLEQELLLMRQAQQIESERLFRRARALKLIATLVAAIAMLAMLVAFYFVLRRSKGAL